MSITLLGLFSDYGINVVRRNSATQRLEPRLVKPGVPWRPTLPGEVLFVIGLERGRHSTGSVRASPLAAPGSILGTPEIY